MTLAIRPQLLANPVLHITVPLSLSFAAWTLPRSSWVFHGWEERTAISFDGLWALIAFYLVIVVAAWLPSRVEPAVEPRRVDENRLEIALLALAALGVGIYSVLVLQRVDVLAALQELSANRLDEALPDEPGLQSFRYLVVPFGALSLVRLVCRRRRLRYLGGVGALMFVGLAAARLLFMMAVFTAMITVVAVYIDRFGTRPMRISLWKWLLVLLPIFLVLVALTYPRVGGTYAARGVTNPLAVTTASLTSYLSTPAQVQLAVGERLGSGAHRRAETRLGPAHDLLLPTFLRSSGRDGKQDLTADRYGRGIDFRTNFTTNSVFADVYVERGPSGLLIIVALVAMSAHAARLALALWPGMAGGLLAGPILYPLTEIWRANVFLLGSQIAVIAGIVLAFGVSSHRSRRRAAARAGRLEAIRV